MASPWDAQPHASSSDVPQCCVFEKRGLGVQIGSAGSTCAEVSFFAYPGGRFNQVVVDAVQSAGYSAACSVIGFARNHVNTQFWLYRDVLEHHADSLRDALRLSSIARKCLGWRAAKRVRVVLGNLH